MSLIKIHYPNSAEDYADMHIKNSVKDKAWSLIHETVPQLTLPLNWQVTWYESSVVFLSPKRTRSVKINIKGDVEVDQRLIGGKFKSEKFSHSSVVEAVEKLKQLFQ